MKIPAKEYARPQSQKRGPTARSEKARATGHSYGAAPGDGRTPKPNGQRPSQFIRHTLRLATVFAGTRAAGSKFRRLTWRLGLALLTCCLPFSASAQNSIHWTTNYYAVTGGTLGEIRQAMRQARPWKGTQDLDGMTDWRIAWRFAVTPTPGGCRCASFTTQTSIVITMPRWTPPTNAPAALREIWQRYITALGQHEAGHAQLALAAAAELQRRIKEVGESADCDGLKNRINGLSRQVIEEFRQRDKAYDERTRHGATQGATLSRRREAGRETNAPPAREE